MPDVSLEQQTKLNSDWSLEREFGLGGRLSIVPPFGTI